MTRDELAFVLYKSHYLGKREWKDVESGIRDLCRTDADAAARALGVTLDPGPSPRYEAALGVLARAHLPTATQEIIAKAIVAAIDADKERT